MRKDRTEMLIDVVFESDGHSEEVPVWVPFSVFVDAVRKYFFDHDVNLDGRDVSIWNAFVSLESIERFEDNDEFIGICRDLYMESEYKETDFEDWKDSLESL